MLKFNRKKISIIDFYLTHNHNTCYEIAKKMGITYWYVSNTITEYLNNDKTITVASKL
jgi:predicted transcriptional regulator